MQQSLSEKQLLKARRIDRAVEEYFESHPEAKTILPCDLMPSLLKKGIYYKPDKEGRQLSNFLCKLEKENVLDLLVYKPAKTKDKSWCFKKVD